MPHAVVVGVISWKRRLARITPPAQQFIIACTIRKETQKLLRKETQSTLKGNLAKRARPRVTLSENLLGRESDLSNIWCVPLSIVSRTLIKPGWDSTAMATRQADHKRRHDAIEDTDPAAASVSLRPRSQRRVVPESLIAPKNRRDNDTSSTASLPPDEEELEVEMEGAEKKQRFVWTPDLHHRFEIAVHKLGVANAKPQAIQQLMGCEDDSTIPTRQNIKSHLQKYRLRTGHRSESGRSASSSGGSQAGGSQAGGSQAGGSQVGFAAPSQAPLDPIAQKQQTGLLEQLELQKKLDAQLLQQRNTQSALDLRMHTAGPGPTLRPAQLQRLARHVLIMRGMLQHLLTLLHAITVDFCAAGQFAQRSFASGPTQVRPHVIAAAT